jgi:hypothetical protein
MAPLVTTSQPSSEPSSTFEASVDAGHDLLDDQVGSGCGPGHLDPLAAGDTQPVLGSLIAVADGKD